MGKFKGEMFGNSQPIKLGAGLLNNASKGLAVEKMEIEYIEIDKILPNKKNEFSMSAIEELAQLINLNKGLEQPLVVREPNEEGEYILLTGHRRLAAIKLLQQQGKWIMGVVPCKIKDLNNIDLPLDIETKEMFSILVTNQYREKTDGDILLEIREWKKIFSELREKGIDCIPLKIDENGNEEPRTIKGERTRTLVAEQMHMKPAQVGRFEKVENQGSEKLLDAVLDNRISLSAAEAVIEMPKEEQNKFMQKTHDKKEITTQDAQKHKEKSEEKVEISSDMFQMSIQGIKDKLLNREMHLTESQYDKYQKCIRQLEKIFQL
ncbi:MAG: ParB/RepB/Spo0J family partition protein [Lachnospiraceae bacterium]